MDLSAFADEVGRDGPVTIAGGSTRGGAVPGVRAVAAPRGIEWIEADEMRVSCAAGTPIDELAEALAEVGQRVALPPGGTVGGALSAGRSGVRLLGDGPMRNAVLQARYVSAAGTLITAGGPTVKNVTGFDLCRLLVGARGTLGFIGDVILRTRPIAVAAQWFTRSTTHPWTDLAALYRPAAVLWDGRTAHVLLEGDPTDLVAQAAAVGMAPSDGPPPLPAHRQVIAPAEEAQLGGTFVCQLGTGVVYTATPPALAVPHPLAAAVKAQFDPGGRLNPGVVVG